MTDPGIKILSTDDFEPGFIEGLRSDHEILSHMELKWREIVANEKDPKLDKFLSVLKTELLAKNQNPEQKLVIFSESLDTTDYLMEKLKLKGYSSILSINSTNRNQLRDEIKQNFDANIPLVQQKSNHNIIITTEVLAEGVNLHRANTILNYDTPWNATRLMQRIGRLNRIGTKANRIHIYNFFPTEKVESDIELQHKAMVKLQAFHSALGEDSQIYSDDEEVETFGLFDKTPQGDDEANERLQYLMEIRRFREESPEEFRRIKNLPLKIRNAVRNGERQNGTITYLRNKRHHAFYAVGQKGELNELGFLEAAPIFKCTPTTKAQLLHERHHHQVQQAIIHFQQQVEGKIVAEQQNQPLTPQQTQAISYLKAMQGLPHLGEQEKQLFVHAVDTIKLGRFQSLPRDVKKLQRNAKKSSLTIEVQLRSLLEIIHRHIPETKDVNTQDMQSTGNKLPDNAVDDWPNVIISQSYI